MGEIIQIHVGQAGVQIANACWELYCLEHGIKADGILCECPCDTTFTNLFDFKTSNKVVPRAILVDSEPTVIDQVRTGAYGRLYSPCSLITGKEDSGSNFARGYYTMGAELIDITMESIRNLAESCCNLRGFLIFRSIGGGTGSGLGNLILEQLLDTYKKVTKMEFIIFPSPSLSPLIAEPYNALLATHLGMDSIECSCILDNEALYDICSKKLNINAPKYKNLNRIIGQTASTFTTSQRFAGSSNVSFSEFQTNLVPYPRIHFPVVSYAPFIPGTGSGYTRLSTEQITTACFEPSSQLVRCNPVDGKYMTSVLLYRGNVSTSDINSSILRLRATDTIRFVDWSPTGFKVGTNIEPPVSIPGGGLGTTNKALVVLSNNTVIRKTWCRLIDKYDRLYRRRAFIHHYIAEGLEESSLAEASEDICTLISDYKEVDKAGTTDNIPVDIKSSRGKAGHGLSRSRSRGLRPARSGDIQASTRPSKSPIRDVSRNHSTSPRGLVTNRSYVVGREASSDVGDLSLPRLPGSQSLNHFFDESVNNEMENMTQPRSAGCVCARNSECECVCDCHVEYNDEEAEGISMGGSSQNSSVISIVTQISIQSSRKQLYNPVRPNNVGRGLSLPTRSHEVLFEDDKFKDSNLRRSKSFQDVGNRDDKPSRGSKKRSRSHEPKRSEGIRRSGQNCGSFDRGFNTEAVRAHDRFLLSSCRTEIFTKRCIICCPGEVLKLPPPRSEGQEVLGEALSAKERFCNSTCQPPRYEVKESVCCRPKDPCRNRFCEEQKPSCSYQVMLNDPCTSQQVTAYCPPKSKFAKRKRMMWMVPNPRDCSPQPKVPKCFCCQDNYNLDYTNSDDKLLPMCRKSTKRKKYIQPDCFCDHDIGGAFNVSNTALLPPQCTANNSCVCYQEEIVCCPDDEAVCESYPQCSSLEGPMICPALCAGTSQCVGEDDDRIKPRLPGGF